MNILFITASRLGDAVLSTGLLAYITAQWPQARITVACGPLAASLFDGLPGRQAVIPLRKQSYNRHWVGLWRATVGTRWDMVVDLRNSAVSRLIRAERRYIYGRSTDRAAHKVEQAAQVMGLPRAAGMVPAPQIWISPAQEQAARALIPEGGPVLAIGPAANWIGKSWPPARFIALIEALTAPDGILPEARVAVFAAPGEEQTASQVLQSVPQSRQLDLIAKTDPGTAAASLARCALYVGNDSGLMHCAAAAGIPTFGLFGPSHDEWYRPWGPHTGFIRTKESFDELISFPGYDPKTLDHSLMVSLQTETVIEAVEKFWREA